MGVSFGSLIASDISSLRVCFLQSCRSDELAGLLETARSGTLIIATAMEERRLIHTCDNPLQAVEKESRNYIINFAFLTP